MLSDLYRSSRAISLGGVTWTIRQLRVRDLAALESWAIDRIGDVWEGLSEAESIEDEGQRHEALRALYDAADSPKQRRKLIDAAINGPEGGVVCLKLALDLEGERLDDETATMLGGCMTESEWASFQRIAFDSDPLDEIAAAIDREIGVAFPTAPGGDWTGAILSVMRWTKQGLEAIGDMPLSAFRVLYAKSSKRSHSIAEPEIPRGWGRERFKSEVQDKRKAFWKGEAGVNGTAK